MISIDKAILHIFDTKNAQMILSDEPIELNGELQTFLADHIAKCFKKTSGKKGRFQENSVFEKNLQDYINNGDFIHFSKTVAKIWFDIIRQAENISPSDLLVCDIRNDDIRYVAFLRMESKRAFSHDVAHDGQMIRNDIHANISILPNPSANGAEEFVFLSVEDKNLFISQKKYKIDGNSIFALSEAVLECTLKPSQEETLKVIQKATEKVAEDFGADVVKAAASVKAAIAQDLDEEEELDPIRTGRAVFSNSPDMQEAFQKKIADAGIAPNERVSVDRESLLKKIVNHKLKTDTGIELVIPSEYFDNTDYIEFSHAEDGSLYITLKHIGSIVNKR